VAMRALLDFLDRRPLVAAMIVFALLVALPALDAVTGQGIYWFHDLRHHHHPWRAWAAAEWLAGRVPLWAPDVANGFPLMSDGQTGVFYPPNILLGLLLPSHDALNASILLHAWWSGLGAWWLCRVLDRSNPASLVAGVAFACSGFMVAHVTYAGMQAVASWAPWALGAALLISRSPQLWRGLPWGLCVAAMLTAGHVQGAAIGLLGSLFVFAAEARRVKAWLIAGAGALVGIATAAPQLAGALELAGLSAREGGVDEAFAGIGSLPPWELINAVLPRFWGWERPADIALTYVHKGPLFFGTGENHWEDCFYLGLPVVALAIWGLARPGGRRWKVMAVGAMLLMLGRFTPVYALFRMVPGFDFFRFPVRFSLLLTLAVVVLAAKGMDDLIDNPRAPRGVWLERLALAGLVAFVGGSLLGFGILAVKEPAIRGILMGPLGERPDGLARIDAFIAGMKWNTTPWSPGVWWTALLIGGTGALAWAFRKGKLGGLAFSASLLALVTADMVSFGYDYNPRVPDDVVEAEPPLVAAVLEAGVGEEGLYRTSVVDRVQPPALDRQLLSSSLGLLYGTRDVILLSPLLIPRHEAVLAAAGLDVGMDPGEEKVKRLAENRKLVDLMGVRYLMSTHDLSGQDGLDVIETDGEVKLHRNDAAMERAFVVGCVDAALDQEAALARMLESDFDPRTVAVVEGAEALRCQSGDEAPGEVSVATYAPDEVRVAATMDAPGLLVLADTHYPGWTVAVDGRPVELLKADVTFRGVMLEAGAHEVVFSYQPWWRKLLWLTGIGWAVLLLGGAVLGVLRVTRR